MRGVNREINKARGASQVLYDSQDTHLSAVIFMHASIDSALSDLDCTH